jgi:hypothetical protein
VQTMLRILEDKAFAAHEEEGRQHRFRAMPATQVASPAATAHRQRLPWMRPRSIATWAITKALRPPPCS